MNRCQTYLAVHTEIDLSQPKIDIWMAKKLSQGGSEPHIKTTTYKGPIKLYNGCHGNQFHPQVHINHWKIHELHRKSLTLKSDLNLIQKLKASHID